MKYYIVTPLEGLHQPRYIESGWNTAYQAFEQDQYYKIPSRTMLQMHSSEGAEFADILFDVFPLFSKNAKKSLDLFWWDGTYREFIFVDQKACNDYSYYLPFFPRMKGDVCFHMNEKQTPETVRIFLDEYPKEDMPAFYITTKSELWMALRLDLIESLMRNGLNGVQLVPFSFNDGEVRADGQQRTECR